MHCWNSENHIKNRLCKHRHSGDSLRLFYFAQSKVYWNYTSNWHEVDGLHSPNVDYGRVDNEFLCSTGLCNGRIGARANASKLKRGDGNPSRKNLRFLSSILHPLRSAPQHRLDAAGVCNLADLWALWIFTLQIWPMRSSIVPVCSTKFENTSHVPIYGESLALKHARSLTRQDVGYLPSSGFSWHTTIMWTITEKNI